MLKEFGAVLVLRRIAVALEDIATQLRYQNERTFPPPDVTKTEGNPAHLVITRRKPDDAPH